MAPDQPTPGATGLDHPEIEDAEIDTAPPDLSGSRRRRRRQARGTRSFRATDLAWYLLLTAMSVIVLFPVYMTFVRAVSNPSRALFQKTAPLWPLNPQWDSFSRAFTEGHLGRPLVISGVVTLIIVIAQTLTSILAAYAFAFLQFPFKRLLFVLTIATLLLPIEVTLITNVKTMQSIGWVTVNQSLGGAIGAMTVPFLATALGIFLIRQGFMGVPRDLRDAALLDGYGNMGFLWRVAVPVTRPIIASFVLISFLSAYDQYVWPRQAVTRSANQTVQLTLRQVAGARLDQFNLPFAAALIASVPVVILLIVFQRQLIRGLTAGAVKG
jgi:sn-glycerol 3-phosphate transport system permease protein